MATADELQEAFDRLSVTWARDLPQDERSQRFWLEELEDLDGAVLLEVVRNFVRAERPWCPTVGQIRGAVQRTISQRERRARSQAAERARRAELERLEVELTKRADESLRARGVDPEKLTASSVRTSVRKLPKPIDLDQARAALRRLEE
jgi:CRP-like cAMP-binding protein